MDLRIGQTRCPRRSCSRGQHHLRDTHQCVHAYLLVYSSDLLFFVNQHVIFTLSLCYSFSTITLLSPRYATFIFFNTAQLTLLPTFSLHAFPRISSELIALFFLA